MGLVVSESKWKNMTDSGIQTSYLWLPNRGAPTHFLLIKVLTALQKFARPEQIQGKE